MKRREEEKEEVERGQQGLVHHDERSKGLVRVYRRRGAAPLLGCPGQC